MKTLIFNALAFFVWAVLPAQNAASGVNFTAEASQTEVLLGNYIRVEFKLENGQGAKFIAPDWPESGFILRGGPNQSSSFSIINGRSTSSFSYTYFIEPRDTGTVVVPAAVVTLNGQEYRSKPIPLRVYVNPNDIIETPQPKEHFDIWGRPTPAPQPEPSVKPKKKRTVTRI